MTTIEIFISTCALFTVLSTLLSVLMRKKFPTKRYDKLLDYVILLMGIGIILYRYASHHWNSISLMFIMLFTLLWVSISFIVYAVAKFMLKNRKVTKTGAEEKLYL